MMARLNINPESSGAKADKDGRTAATANEEGNSTSDMTDYPKKTAIEIAFGKIQGIVEELKENPVIQQQMNQPLIRDSTHTDDEGSKSL